jgi:hypothetical protein
MTTAARRDRTTPEPLGRQCLIVAIDPSTRGSGMPQADTPCLIRLYAAPSQDQDEKGSRYARPTMLLLASDLR